MIPPASIRAALETMTPAEIDSMDIARVAAMAGQLDAVDSLFLAPAYLEHRLRQPQGLTVLLDEFDILASQSSRAGAFRSIGDALRLSADILVRDATQLATQLLARLPIRERDEIAQLRNNLRAECPAAFWPVTTSLIPATQSFVTLQLADTELVALACSPNGNLVVTLDKRGDLHFVVLKENRLQAVARIACPQAVTLDIVPSGSRLIVGTEDGRISWIDPRSRAWLGTSHFPRQIQELTCLDETRVVVAHDGGVSVVEWAEGRELAIVGQSEGLDTVSCVTASVDGRRIYSGAVNGRVDAWLAADGRFDGRVGWFGPYDDGFTSRAEGMLEALMRSGAWMATEEDASPIDFEDALAGMPPEMHNAARRMIRKDPHADAVMAVVVGSSDKTVIAGSARGELIVWDARSGEKLAVLDGHEGAVMSLAVEPGGRRLVSAGDRSLCAWDLDRGAPIGRLPTRSSRPHLLRCSASGGVVVGACDDGTLAAWRLDTAASAPVLDSQDGRMLRIACHSAPARIWALNTARRCLDELGSDSGRRIRSFPIAVGEIDHAEFSPGARRLAVCDPVGVHVIDVATQVSMYFMPFGDAVEAEEVGKIAVSDNGDRVVIACAKAPMAALLGADSRLVLADMARGTTRVLGKGVGQVQRLAVSPCGSTVVLDSAVRSGGEFQGRRSFLDLREEGATRVEEVRGGMRGFALHPSDGGVYWCEGQAVMREAADARSGATPVLTTSAAWRDIAFADGGHLAILSAGARMELWDLAERSRLAGFEADRPIVSCGVLTDAGVLAVLDGGGGLHLLRIPPRSAGTQQAPRGSAGRNAGSLASRIDAIAASESDGHRSGSTALWKELAAAARDPAVLGLGVARVLHRAGHRSDALELLLRTVGRARGVERSMGVDLLYELGYDDGVASLFLEPPWGNDVVPEELVILSKSADWLVSQGKRELLSSIAGGARSDAGRLIAAQALAEVDEAAAIAALDELVCSAAIGVGCRVLALISLRALQPAKQWLARLQREPSIPTWTVDMRLILGREVLGAFQKNATSPIGASADGRPPAIEPLRRPLEWDQQAVELSTQGRYEEAISLVSRSIRRRPMAARYFHTRAMLRLAMARERGDQRKMPGHVDQGHRQLELALEDLTEAIDRDRCHESAWSQRGYAFLELGRYDFALQDISEAIHLDGTDPVDFKNRAYCLKQLGRHAEAVEDEERARQVAWHKRQGTDRAPIQQARHRAGDDEVPDTAELDEIGRQARVTLERLGVFDEVADELRQKACAVSTRTEFVQGAVSSLVRLRAQDHLQALAKDSRLGIAGRVTVLAALIEGQADSETVEALMVIANDPAIDAEDRDAAGMALVKAGPLATVVGLLRRLEGVDLTNPEARTEIALALHFLKSLVRRAGGAEAVADLAADPGVSASLREIACEVVGSFVDKTRGCQLLHALGAELRARDPLQDFVRGALEFYAADGNPELASDQQDETNTATEAYVAFCRARSADEVDILAREHRVFHDPDFVDLVAARGSDVPAAERTLYTAKVVRLRQLPEDVEVVAFRTFARANSAQAMKAAVESYPILSLPEYYPVLLKTIEGIGENERPAFERRLGWLRALPPDPWQMALQAFANASSDEQLQAAIEAHPHLSHPRFRTLAERILGGRSDWPDHECRLKKLSTMSRPAQVFRWYDEAARALVDGDPHTTLERLDRLGELAHDRHGRRLRALALEFDGKQQEAIALLNELIDEAPDAMLLTARGRAFNKLQRFREAEADFSKALEFDPDVFDCWLGRGLANAQLNRPREAVADLTRAEALKPEEQLIYAIRGMAYSTLGQLDDAIADLRKTIRYDPSQPAIYAMLATMLASAGRRDEALQVLREARVHIPEAELSDIRSLEAGLAKRAGTEASPEEMNRVFNVFMNVRTSDELFDAVQHEPLLSNPGFIEAIDNFALNAPDRLAARQCEERLAALRSLIAGNPAQAAFDALMSASSPAAIRDLRGKHPILSDPAFLDHLSEIAVQLESGSERDHLRSCLDLLK